MRLLFFIPSYNDQDCLPALIDTMLATYPAAKILVVDDGSEKELTVPNVGDQVILYRLSFNVGLGIVSGIALDYCLDGQFDVMVRVDADGQHPVGSVGELIKPIQEGRADVVWGERNNHLDFKTPKGILGAITKQLTAKFGNLIFGSEVQDWHTGFYALNRCACEAAAKTHLERYCEVQMLCVFLNSSLRVVTQRIDQIDRQFGQTSIQLLSGLLIFFRSILIMALYALRMHPK